MIAYSSNIHSLHSSYSSTAFLTTIVKHVENHKTKYIGAGIAAVVAGFVIYNRYFDFIKKFVL